MDVRNLQSGAQKPPKWSPEPSKIEPKWGQEGARTAQKSKNNINPTKNRSDSISVAPFYWKTWPTWPQLGSQDGAKMEKKSMQKSIKNLMHLGIDFWKDLEGFWEPKWSHVGTQIDQKSMPIAKSVFLKNPVFANHIDFSSILGPTCLHFPSQIHQNPSKNQSQDASNF